MIFKWKNNKGSTEKKAFTVHDAICGIGYDRLIFTGYDMQELNNMSLEQLKNCIGNLAGRAYSAEFIPLNKQ